MTGDIKEWRTLSTSIFSNSGVHCRALALRLSSWAVGAFALRLGLLGFAGSGRGHTAIDFSKRGIGRDVGDRRTQLVAETRDHLEFARHHRIKTCFGDIRSVGLV